MIPKLKTKSINVGKYYVSKVLTILYGVNQSSIANKIGFRFSTRDIGVTSKTENMNKNMTNAQDLSFENVSFLNMFSQMISLCDGA
jgi:hypothetical protein